MSIKVRNTPQVRRAAGTSLHRQIFNVLRDEIARGVYAGTGVLPTEEAICERYGVSRITVRRALTDLASQGLVERRHGLGTFVKMQVSGRQAPSLSLVESLRKAAQETQVKVIEVSQAEAPPDIAAQLLLAADERAVHALRLRCADRLPVMLTDAWIPAAMGTGVSAASLKKHALYELLMNQGVTFGSVVQEITAQLADPVLAKLLGVEVGAPLLKLVRLMHDQANVPVLHISIYLSPERSRILMDFQGESVNTLVTGRIVHDR
ncbi:MULTISPECIES: GntR family transcriptional regulator [Cupriavidus]|uniref:GntR family transcriptional regulator n=1 Tax=Cupriavidus alkaliphilus TaxID=942866 RepID=A0A7W4YSL9_9BURK|nr:MULTISPECIES: GntR family transcriptional regulator [Cupriavidus]MBB3009975.1 GntR family transcriptional regulator [Cupriavidus alkaliphilus]GLC97248.1 GntR family transcriptional regulator [Cupriavidus sp. TA19]